MSNELKVTFTGLCGFVPRYALGTTDPTELQQMRMRALLVDARGQHPGHGSHVHIHHEPVLLVPQGRVHHGTGFRDYDAIFFDRARNAWEVFLLGDQDLTVVGAALGGLEFDDTVLIDDCPAAAGDGESFRWVVPMNTVSAGSGTVIQDCLNAGGHASVGARVQMTEGRVTINQFAVDAQNKVLKWGFGPATGGGVSGQRAIAEQVQWSHPFTTNPADPKVDLKTTYFRRTEDGIPQGTQQVIRLVPRSIGGFLEVSVRVLNSPWANILDRIKPSDPRQVDTHFEHLYGMSHGFAGAKHVLHPRNGMPRCPENPFTNVDTPKCPPTQFGPNPSA